MSNRFVLGAAAVAALAASRSAIAQYTFRELDTNGFSTSQVRDVANGMAVGYGVVPGASSDQKAIAWPLGGGASRIDLSHGFRSDALGVDNAGHIAGAVYFETVRIPDAGYWPTVNSAPVDYSADLGFSYATATQDQKIVGWGHRLQAPNPIPDSAFLWDVSSKARTPLPGPGGSPASYASGVDGRWVVGDSATGNGGNPGAAAWDIGDSSDIRAIKLHPAGFDYSSSKSVSGDRAVGLARESAGGFNHAYLWDLNTTAARDLHAMLPASFDAVASSASDLRGDVVVGSAMTASGELFAVQWNLATNSAIDLRQFLPASATFSTTAGINDDGQIVGDWRVGSDNNVFVLTPQRVNGDADNNGRVDFDDYARIDTGFNNHVNGWSNGDFNYDGRIDFDDYAMIDTSFQLQNGGGGSGGAGVVVPEPASLSALTLGATLMCRRRNRR